MEVIIQPNSKHASSLAARLIVQLIRKKPNAVLGCATGKTPRLLYKELIRLYQKKEVHFSHVTTFNLDEYVGLSKKNKNSFHSYMEKNLFSQVNINPKRVYSPDGTVKNIPQACANYEKAIARAGGIDVQILGIGKEGHIGFNEPSSSLSSRTRIKTLTQQTRKNNAAPFGSLKNVPTHAITMGIETIMESKMILLLAFGKEKASVVAKMIEGLVTASLPASILQYHPNVKIFLDPPASLKLLKADYYKEVFQNKPVWQRF